MVGEWLVNHQPEINTPGEARVHVNHAGPHREETETATMMTMMWYVAISGGTRPPAASSNSRASLQCGANLGVLP